MRWPWPAAEASAAAISAAAHLAEPVFPATTAFDVGGTGCGGGHVSASAVSGNVAPAAHRLARRGADDIGESSGSALYGGRGVVETTPCVVGAVGGVERMLQPASAAPWVGWKGRCSRHGGSGGSAFTLMALGEHTGLSGLSGLAVLRLSVLGGGGCRRLCWGAPILQDTGGGRGGGAAHGGACGRDLCWMKPKAAAAAAMAACAPAPAAAAVSLAACAPSPAAAAADLAARALRLRRRPQPPPPTPLQSLSPPLQSATASAAAAVALAPFVDSNCARTAPGGSGTRRAAGHPGTAIAVETALAVAAFCSAAV